MVLIHDRKGYSEYWQKRRSEPAGPDDIRLVALGDSTVQAVGASSPLKGMVGQVAGLIERETGRMVHIDNVSVFGAKAYNVADEQLKRIDAIGADIIMVAVGANDAIRVSDIDTYRDAMQRIVAALPPEKTVIADVAMVKNRDEYQEILNDLRTRRGTLRADIEKAFHDHMPTKSMVARDFFHPNDYGYTFWFAAFEPAIRQLIVDRHLAK